MAVELRVATRSRQGRALEIQQRSSSSVRLSNRGWQGQQTFALVAKHFFVADNPSSVGATATHPLLGENSPQPAPFANGELRLPHQQRQLVGRVLSLNPLACDGYH